MNIKLIPFSQTPGVSTIQLQIHFTSSFDFPSPAVNVTVNIYVRSIREFNDKDMSFKAQLTFRQQWRDPRLAFTEKQGLKYITLHDASLIWTPDVFFSDTIDGHKHEILSKNELVRIFPDGSVMYSARITLHLSCPMNFINFPMDKHTCSMTIYSYGYTTEDLVLMWGKGTPLQIGSSVPVHQFVMVSYSTSNYTSRTSTGGYSSIIGFLTFARDTKLYLMKIYIPCICLVIVSYLSLWAKNTNTRYLIALLTLLTGGLGIGFLNETMPQVSYTKVIDIWTRICLTFMFATLVLIVIEENLPQQKAEVDHCLIDGKPSTRRCQVKVSRFEKIARIVYPCVFTSFVVLYFIVYRIKA